MAARPAHPAWVRPVYLYAVCLVAALVMIYGAVNFVLGGVTTAFPKTDSNPITQIANGIIDVVDKVAAGRTSPSQANDLNEGLAAARSAIDKQARNRGITRMVGGAVFFAAGLVAHLLAWRRVNAERFETAPVQAYYPPPATGPPAPYAPQPPPPPQPFPPG